MEEIDFENRELCPDGSCTGILNAEGRCKECGRTGDDAARSPEPTVTPELSAVRFDPDQRRLCADGRCTGLLGSDGKCRECGQLGDVAVPT